MGFQPLAQQRLDLALELVGGREARERGSALRRHEPALEERLQPRPLHERVIEPGGVVDGEARPLGLAKDENVGPLLARPCPDGAQHFIAGRTRIRLAARHAGKLRRQLGTEARPKDRQHDVAIGRFGSLTLGVSVRAVR